MTDARASDGVPVDMSRTLGAEDYRQRIDGTLEQLIGFGRDLHDDIIDSAIAQCEVMAYTKYDEANRATGEARVMAMWDAVKTGSIVGKNEKARDLEMAVYLANHKGYQQTLAEFRTIETERNRLEQVALLSDAHAKAARVAFDSARVTVQTLAKVLESVGGE